MENQGEILIYQTEVGKNELEVRLYNESNEHFLHIANSDKQCVSSLSTFSSPKRPC